MATAAVLLVTAQATACSTCQSLTPVSMPTPSPVQGVAPVVPTSGHPPPAPFLAVVPAPVFPGAGAPRASGRVRAARSPKILPRELGRALDVFLAGYGGRTAASVRELGTGRHYHYHHTLQLPSANTSKVSILTALLLGTRWRELGERARSDASNMIRFSDNEAADRLYERIGLESGLASANRRFGLKRTYTPGGGCEDRYCWGVAQTTAEDQIRLVKALATAKSPLASPERRKVLGLMEKVTPEQKWGISAGACETDQVALKNGWLRHVANGRWAVASAGLIRADGHDYAVAVLTEDSPTMETGIARIEGVTERLMNAFRGGCEATAN
ncbi:serine hydrolase [Streptosporangium sp. G11]|uniref:serine hydrolase n=1 Tax=Streptosporangium sp. G11 TaxID=3436926 RepID=UPI003EB927D6